MPLQLELLESLQNCLEKSPLMAAYSKSKVQAKNKKDLLGKISCTNFFHK